MWFRLTSAGFVVSLCMIITATLHAQLSPGDLTKGHASLEGIQNCTQCHDVGQKLDGSKCLACHVELKTRVDQGKGFHASQKVKSKECIACHFDHKGRDFNIIYWEGGKDHFDHDLTGYKLEGKHQTDKCETCHQPGQIVDALVQGQAGKTLSLKNTFLGLSQDCKSCHFDEHRGQLKQDCITCHDFEDWKKSSERQFDHGKAAYKLTGLHVQVECVKCHALTKDPKPMKNGKTDADYFKYKPLAFQNCTSCHKDVHENRFGQKCTQCHSTLGWKFISGKDFDHSLTLYPLVGKHAAVSCEACHQPDLKKLPVYKGLPFGKCADCHRDEHVGQLTARTDSGSCESCHGLTGFVPSTFTVERHNTESKYQLLGQHSKTLCAQCHPKTSPADFERRTGIPAPPDSTVILHFTDQRCASCHEDIHRGQFMKKVQEQDCAACHRTTTWKELVFDHAKDASFALLGKHKEIECKKCHPTLDEGTPIQRVLYKPLRTYCESCHKDTHEGQFGLRKQMTDLEPSTSCESCHTSDAWKPSIFDHLKSRFVLTGAHEKVLCEKCHPQVIIRSDSLNTLYKPIDTACASCHPDIHEGAFER